MELTKEYFDKQIGKLVSKESLKEELKTFATKEDLKVFATKDDLKSELKAQSEDLKSYTEEVAQSILEAVDYGFNRVDKHLGVLDKQVDNLTVHMAFMATKQDITEIKDKLQEVNKRNTEDSNLFSRKLVAHDHKFAKIEKDIHKMKMKKS